MLLFAGPAVAQQYSYYKQSLPHYMRDSLLQGGQIILQAPAQDTLSSAQALPFSWQFYNKPVDSYYVSDNGFITFEQGSGELPPAYPAPGPPDWAIYAFAADWRLQFNEFKNEEPDRIYKATFGQAPNRIHVIHWHSVSATPDNPFIDASASFALLLFEQGGIEMLRTQASQWVRDSMWTVTGTEDPDGSDGRFVSQGAPQPFRSEGLTYSGYRFHRRDSAALDLGVTQLLNERLQGGQPSFLKFVIKNFGDTLVNRFNLHYSIDGFMPITMAVNNVALAPHGDTTLVIHTTPFSPNPNASKGEHVNVRAWADHLNGNQSDDHTANDTLERDLRVTIGQSAQRQVLLEHFWLSNCGFCPDGQVMRQAVRDSLGSDRLVLLQHHAAVDGQRDSLSLPLHKHYAEQWAAGANEAMINRQYQAQLQRMALPRSLWAQRAQHQLEAWTPLHVTLEAHKTNGAAYEVTATIHFTDFPPKNQLRLGMVLKAERVSKPSEASAQRNYYSEEGGAAGGPAHPFYAQPDPIPDYSYRHVALQRVTPAGGHPLPAEQLATIEPGDSLQYTFSASLDALPDALRYQDLHVVGWVAHASPDVRKRGLLNAAQTLLSDTVIAGREQRLARGASSASPVLQIAPNPTANPLHWRLQLPQAADQLRLAVFDAQGRRVHGQRLGPLSAGPHSGSLRLGQRPAGVYYLRVRGRGVQQSRAFYFQP
jgi:hypothetical protein